jgi:hypothetical protein
MGVRRNYARETRCTNLIVLDSDSDTGVSDKQLAFQLVFWKMGGGGFTFCATRCNSLSVHIYVLCTVVRTNSDYALYSVK